MQIYGKLLTDILITGEQFAEERRGYMKLTFIGADHEVTGSCHYLEACGKNILIDYGMEQGVKVFENVPLPVEESLIDYVLLTHAHIDHSGMLPLLYAKGFRGRVLMTDASADLCSIMFVSYTHLDTCRIRSAVCAILRLCVIIIIVCSYFFDASFNSAITSLVFCESKFPVGSSARIKAGRVNKARPIATLCCCPPDS